MTQEEYTNHEGDLCPSCGSDDISTVANVHVYPEAVYRKAQCANCGATWEEELRIVGYWRLKRGNKGT